MMTRQSPLLLAVLLLAIKLPLHAQSGSAPATIPISGRVLNAVTGEPIAGATVHYRGGGNVSDGEGHLAAPPTLQGEVTTGADGTYATPALPAFGDFTIRASAPGFFAAKDHVQALPARLVNREPPPLPPGVTRPPGYKPPPPHDGVLRLQPDPVDLRPMSDAALANFALPLRGYPNRRYLASAFASDGDRLAFLTEDTVGPPPAGDIVFEAFHRCAAWVYDLKSGILSSELGLPPRACEGGGPIVWQGDTFYIPLPADFSPPTLQAAQVKGRFVNTLPIANLPKAVQDELARATAEKSAAGGDRTADGRFTIAEDDSGNTGRGSCGQLVTKPATGATRTISQACPGSTDLVDPVRDLVFFTQPTQTRYPNAVEDIGEFNLKTGRRRVFPVPIMNEKPELLAFHPLPNGTTRIAYTISGDCDYSTSDYSQPGQPDGVLGNTPNQFSVCFVTIPADHSSTAPSGSQASQ